MFNLQRFLNYIGGVLLRVFPVILTFFLLSWIAVTIWAVTNDAPIVPMCPAVERSPHVSAADLDGKVSHVAITGGGIDGITLSGITPAEQKGEALNATVSVLDTTPAGSYDVEMTFANDDVPEPQTVTCTVNVVVAKITDPSGNPLTVYAVQGAGESGAPRTKNPLRAERVVLGTLPGLLAILAAAWMYGQFVTPLYGLDSVWTGLTFLSYNLFGRPGFAPYLVIEDGGLTFGEEIVKKVGGPASLVVRQNSAVVLECRGNLTRVIRGPAFPVLEQFEQIWDSIDLRPQFWPFKVEAMTRDGIPVSYEVAVKFRVGDTDDDVFKAATAKWIREANRTDPDRLMTWTRRLVIGATEGTMRRIMAGYELDDLIDPNCRREIRRELERALKSSAAGLGIEMMDVSLRDVEFGGAILADWVEEWKMRRSVELRKVEAEKEAEKVRALEKVKNRMRKEKLEEIVKILSTMTSEGQERIYNDYVVLSFIEMIRRTTHYRLPRTTLKRLSNLEKWVQEKRETGEWPSGKEPDEVNQAIKVIIQYVKDSLKLADSAQD